MILIEKALLKEISTELFSIDMFPDAEEFKSAVSKKIHNIKSADPAAIMKSLDEIDKTGFKQQYLAILESFLSTEVARNMNILELFFQEGMLENFLKKYRVQGPIIMDRRSLAAYDVSDFLRERIFVETGYDTDLDGKKDLIEIYITRPCETLKGMKVPTILIANPYLMMSNDEVYENYLHDVNLELVSKNPNELQLPQKTGEITVERKSSATRESAECNFPVFDAVCEYLDSHRSKGYATVFSPGRGSMNSEGINVCGSKLEIEAITSVLKWLSGEAKAYTDIAGTYEIKCTWSNGSVGMGGKSYLGTLCIGTATTGLTNLKTIVPEAAISNWYSYFRTGGLTNCCIGYQGDDIDLLTWSCQSFLMNPHNSHPAKRALWEETLEKIRNDMDRESGDYNEFWDERNYLNAAKDIKCSILIVHGIEDWNVKTDHCFHLWEATKSNDIVRNMVLHRGEHIYIYNLEEYDFGDYIHRWFDHWLLGVDNGFKNGTVTIQDNLDLNEWRVHEELHPDRIVYFSEHLILTEEKGTDESVLKFVDDIQSLGYDYKKDNQQDWLDNLILDNTENCIKIQSNALPEELLINGSVEVEFTASADAENSILCAMLVDLGKDIRFSSEPVDSEGEPLRLGINAATMNMCKFKFQETLSEYKVISRGWLKAPNSSPESYKIPMIHTDHRIKAGHKLMLIIYGQDAQYTLRGLKPRTISVEERSIRLVIPTL